MMRLLTPEELRDRLLRSAAGLMEGEPAPHHNREYLRGMVELICDVGGVSIEDYRDATSHAIMLLAGMLPSLTDPVTEVNQDGGS